MSFAICEGTDKCRVAGRLVDMVPTADIAVCENSNSPSHLAIEDNSLADSGHFQFCAGSTSKSTMSDLSTLRRPLTEDARNFWHCDEDEWHDLIAHAKGRDGTARERARTKARSDSDVC